MKQNILVNAIAPGPFPTWMLSTGVGTGGDVEGTDWDALGRTMPRGRIGTPEEANQILAQLTGPNGALRNLHVSRRDPFGRTQFGFSGVADLSKGLDSFGDAGLAAALDGKPLGDDQAAIEKRTGQKLADSFHLDITAKLPGDTRTWSPRLGDPPLRMESDGTVYHWGPLILLFVAAGCVLAFALVMVRRALKTATGG